MGVLARIVRGYYFEYSERRDWSQKQLHLYSIIYIHLYQMRVKDYIHQGFHNGHSGKLDPYGQTRHQDKFQNKIFFQTGWTYGLFALPAA